MTAPQPGGSLPPPPPQERWALLEPGGQPAGPPRRPHPQDAQPGWALIEPGAPLGWALIDGHTAPAIWTAGLPTTVMPLIHHRPILELLDDRAIEVRPYWDNYANRTCSWCFNDRQPCTCDGFPLCDAARWRPGDPILGPAPPPPSTPSTPDTHPGPMAHHDWEQLYAHLEED